MTPQSLLLPCRRATTLLAMRRSMSTTTDNGNKRKLNKVQKPHEVSASLLKIMESSKDSKDSKEETSLLSILESNKEAHPSKVYSQFPKRKSKKTDKSNKEAAEASNSDNDTNEDDTTTTPSKIYSQFTKPKKHYNKKKKPDFLTPGAPVETPFYTRTGGGKFRMTMPTLNAAALFENNHPEAFLQVLREEIPKRRRLYFLTGHSVPTQLLESHLQLADSLLHEAAECSFNNFHGNLTFDDWYVWG